MSEEIKYGFKNHDEEQFPLMVQAMINNTCNLSCNHCPHPKYRESKDFEQKYMSIEIFDKISKEVADHPHSSIRILPWGEPLLHSEITTMVNNAKNQGVKNVLLITNGTLLNSSKSYDLISAGLDMVEISLDAFTPETYALTRNAPQQTFQKILQNIEDLINNKEKLNSKIFVNVSIINQPKAEHEVAKFVEYWKEIVDEVLVRKFHDFMGYAKDKNSICLPERYPCRALWTRFNINPEGKVTICYNDWKDEHIIGDLNELDANIEQIWQGEIYNKYRESHLDKKYFGLCEKCNTWIGSDWKQPYELLLNKAKQKNQSSE